ncbi:PaaI family thioesterase [Hydrocarboniphaga effusa]|jgi:acyl-coenzyme A thioesterase 13|uniref:PaaI family thioesterase n=1 Tax=Hydrocarboniphaga effusa TaxID=243629 RepID=UPI003138024F
MSTERPDIPAGFSLLEPTFNRSYVGRIGPFWVRRENGYPVLGVRADEHHCNPFKELHGGFIAGFADFAAAYTLIAGPEPTPTVVTLQLSTQMIASARLGDWVEARGRIRRKGRSIAFVDVEFTSAGKLIAASDAVFRVLSEAGVSERFRRRGEAPSPPA